MSPWLARGLAVLGVPVICMDARRAADAVKSRRVKSDKADAFTLAEMLRTGGYSAVHVKSEESHRRLLAPKPAAWIVRRCGTGLSGSMKRAQTG